MSKFPKPEVSFHAFDSLILERAIGLVPPPFTTKEEVFGQLRYLEQYVGHPEMGCRSLVVETPYVDRDHMEDHGAFYSRNLFPYANYCTRVHFFTLNQEKVETELHRSLRRGVEKGLEGYREASDSLSKSYLGFSVIKPLRGSPVGRTILRSFGEIPSDRKQAEQFRRIFSGTRDRKVHLLGVELKVRGLEFQQQDAAVSACATTAIWSSLQKMGDHEEISPATPAQITMLASRYSLPFGRAMPSEGLSIDQMCQAIQALGVSPSVLRAENYETARGFLYAAITSQMVPILILEHGESCHAVAVAGAKLGTLKPKRDAAEKLIGLYVHDDRMGPYRRARLSKNDDLTAFIEIPDSEEVSEVWQLTHIITPLYPKNRLALSGLRDAALDIHVNTSRLCEMLLMEGDLAVPDFEVAVDYRVLKPHAYISEQFAFEDTDPTAISRLLTAVPLPRYVGVVRVSGDWFGEIDVLLDTTSTLHNAQCLAVVIWSGSAPTTQIVGRYLAEQYECAFVGVD